MPQEFEKILKPFYARKSCGLNLSVDIVQSSSGKIEVISNVNLGASTGTEIILILPNGI